MAICFAISEISLLGRTAAGVKSMGLSEGDHVAYAFVHNDEGEVLLVSDAGYIKRCLLIDFEQQARGGKGSKCFGFTKNGAVGSRIAGALHVMLPYDFEIIQKNGTRTRMNTEAISIETARGKGEPCVVVVLDDVVVGLERSAVGGQ